MAVSDAWGFRSLGVGLYIAAASIINFVEGYLKFGHCLTFVCFLYAQTQPGLKTEPLVSGFEINQKAPVVHVSLRLDFCFFSFVCSICFSFSKSLYTQSCDFMFLLCADNTYNLPASKYNKWNQDLV